MFANAGYPSVADIAAAFPNRGSNDGNNGWGDNGAWWIIVLLLAMWGGFGNGGWGNGGGGRNSASEFTDAAVQRGFDNQAVMNKLNGIEQGLCSLGYDQLAQMNGINTNIMQSAFGIQQAINADTIANMQNTNAISRQLADCCCDNRAAIKDVQYAIAQNGCDTRTQIHEASDAIVQNQNWNARDLNDAIRNGFAAVQQQNDQRYIAELERKINNAERKSEFSEWATYITNYLAPKTNPAYLACNPCSGTIIPESAIQQIAYQVACQMNRGNNCGCNDCCGNNYNRCC